MKIVKWLFTMVVMIASMQLLHAAQPKWYIIPLSNQSVQIPPNGAVHVQYQVINNTQVTRTLVLVQKPGIKQGQGGTCGQTFTLENGASCVLDIIVSSAAIGVPNLGPEICKTQNGTNAPDPFLCSQAAAANQIHATRGPDVR